MYSPEDGKLANLESNVFADSVVIGTDRKHQFLAELENIPHSSNLRSEDSQESTWNVAKDSYGFN